MKNAQELSVQRGGKSVQDSSVAGHEPELRDYIQLEVLGAQLWYRFGFRCRGLQVSGLRRESEQISSWLVLNTGALLSDSVASGLRLTFRLMAYSTAYGIWVSSKVTDSKKEFDSCFGAWHTIIAMLWFQGTSVGFILQPGFISDVHGVVALLSILKPPCIAQSTLDTCTNG